MEQAARAVLATKGHEPRTHRGVVQAFNNQFIRSGEMNTRWGGSLEDGNQARNTADYSAFYRASEDEAQEQCAEAAEFLTDTRQYLVKKGLKDLPNVSELTERKPLRRGGDPAVKNPPQRPKIAPPATSGYQRNRRYD